MFDDRGGDGVNRPAGKIPGPSLLIPGMGQNRSLNPQRTGPFPECPYAKRGRSLPEWPILLGQRIALAHSGIDGRIAPSAPHSGNGPKPLTRPTKNRPIPGMPLCRKEAGQSRNGPDPSWVGRIALAHSRIGGRIAPSAPHSGNGPKPLTRPTKNRPIPGMPLCRKEAGQSRNGPVLLGSGE